jgi:hypothetical protein
MIVVFCIGLIIGTIAGMFSWLAAAAVLESKRGLNEGLFAGLAVQPEVRKTAPEPAAGVPEERSGPLFRPRGRPVGPAIPAPSIGTTRRPSKSV